MAQVLQRLIHVGNLGGVLDSWLQHFHSEQVDGNVEDLSPSLVSLSFKLTENEYSSSSTPKTPSFYYT